MSGQVIVHRQPAGSYSGCAKAPSALLRVRWNLIVSHDLNWVKPRNWDMAPSQKGGLW